MPGETLAKLLTTGRTAVLPKYTAPEVFNPRNGDVKKFVSTFEKAATFNGWAAKDKLILLGQFLEGAASIWYDNFKKKNSFPEGQMELVWKTVIEKLKNNYDSGTSRQDLEFLIRDRRQHPEEDVKTYYHDLETLCHELDAEMSFKTFYGHFLTNLHEDLQTSVAILEEGELDKEKLQKIVYKVSRMNKTKKIQNLALRHTASANVLALAGLQGGQQTLHQPTDQKTLQKKTGNSSVKCFYCGKKGHYMANCNVRKRELETTQRQNYNSRAFNLQRNTAQPISENRANNSQGHSDRGNHSSTTKANFSNNQGHRSAKSSNSTHRQQRSTVQETLLTNRR